MATRIGVGPSPWTSRWRRSIPCRRDQLDDSRTPRPSLTTPSIHETTEVVRLPQRLKKLRSRPRRNDGNVIRRSRRGAQAFRERARPVRQVRALKENSSPPAVHAATPQHPRSRPVVKELPGRPRWPRSAHRGPRRPSDGAGLAPFTSRGVGRPKSRRSESASPAPSDGRRGPRWADRGQRGRPGVPHYGRSRGCCACCRGRRAAS